MKRLATFLLLLGVVIGIAVQPAQALAPAMATMSMAQAATATMPDCAEMGKDATPAPCTCDMAGCIAMMATGAPFLPADASPALAARVASEPQDRTTIVATLRGRSTAPEPEPPALPI